MGEKLYKHDDLVLYCYYNKEKVFKSIHMELLQVNAKVSSETNDEADLIGYANGAVYIIEVKTSGYYVAIDQVNRYADKYSSLLPLRRIIVVDKNIKSIYKDAESDDIDYIYINPNKIIDFVETYGEKKLNNIFKKCKQRYYYKFIIINYIQSEFKKFENRENIKLVLFWIEDKKVNIILEINKMYLYMIVKFIVKRNYYKKDELILPEKYEKYYVYYRDGYPHFCLEIKQKELEEALRFQRKLCYFHQLCNFINDDIDKISTYFYLWRFHFYCPALDGIKYPNIYSIIKRFQKDN